MPAGPRGDAAVVVGFEPGQCDLSGVDQGVGVGFSPAEPGDDRLPHRPPLELRVDRLEVFLEAFPQGDLVVGVGNRRVQGTDAAETRLEGGFGPPSVRVPAFEIAEDRRHAAQGMDAGVGEGFGGQVGAPVGQVVDIEPVDPRLILGPPQ